MGEKARTLLFISQRCSCTKHASRSAYVSCFPQNWYGCSRSARTG